MSFMKNTKSNGKIEININRNPSEINYNAFQVSCRAHMAKKNNQPWNNKIKLKVDLPPVKLIETYQNSRREAEEG